MSATTKIKIPAALRVLNKYGADALKPTRVIDELPSKRQRWHSPMVSKRVANTLRKKAIRNGTYGTYDATTGIGWDKSWDINEKGNHTNDFNSDRLPWMDIRPYKETKRERTREARAKKIEDLVTVADEKILEYRLAEKAKKPPPGVESRLKKLMKGK